MVLTIGMLAGDAPAEGGSDRADDIRVADSGAVVLVEGRGDAIALGDAEVTARYRLPVSIAGDWPALHASASESDEHGGMVLVQRLSDVRRANDARLSEQGVADGEWIREIICAPQYTLELRRSNRGRVVRKRIQSRRD